MTGKDLIALYASSAETKQMSNYLGFQKKPVDLFSTPLDTPEDLTAITKSYRYKGMTMKVLNTATTNVMTEYWWTGSEWKLIEQGKDYDAEIAALQKSVSGVQLDIADVKLDVLDAQADIIDLQSAKTSTDLDLEEIHEILSGLQVASATTVIVQSASTTIYTYNPPSGESIIVDTEEEAKEMAKESGGTYTTTEVQTEEKTVTNTYITDINVSGSDMEEPDKE